MGRRDLAAGVLTAALITLAALLRGVAFWLLSLAAAGSLAVIIFDVVQARRLAAWDQTPHHNPFAPTLDDLKAGEAKIEVEETERQRRASRPPLNMDKFNELRGLTDPAPPQEPVATHPPRDDVALKIVHEEIRHIGPHLLVTAHVRITNQSAASMELTYPVASYSQLGGLPRVAPTPGSSDATASGFGIDEATMEWTRAEEARLREASALPGSVDRGESVECSCLVGPFARDIGPGYPEYELSVSDALQQTYSVRRMPVQSG